MNERVIANYDVADEITLSELVTAVRRRIDFGWQPYGPPFVRNGRLCQALVVYS